MRPRCLLLTLVVVLSLAGCGGDSKSDGKPSAPSADQRKGQDAEAKSNARNLVSQMEACYADQQTYSSCTLEADGTVAGSDTGLTQGSAGGQVSSTGTDTGYEVTATSKSGNSFVITKADDGTLERACTKKGDGGCSAAGDW